MSYTSKLDLFKKILDDTSEQNRNFLEKLTQLFHLLKFYKNFRKGLSSKEIFHELPTQNQHITAIVNNLQKDSKLIDKLFTTDVKKFLNTQKLEKNIDFDKRKNSIQIGLNTIYVDKPISGLWTTGMATFYIPTRTDLNNNLSITLRSITPLKVDIGFNKIKLKTLFMPKLSTKTVDLHIPSQKINESVSEIFISTDKLWLPNIILGTKKSLTLGIGIKSISVSYS